MADLELFGELLRRSRHVRKVIAKACRESFLEGQQAGERKAASVLDAIKIVSRLTEPGPFTKAIRTE